MVQPRFSRQLSRCLRFSQSQSRAIHCSPRRCSPTPLSIASLLDSAPAETENVTVNGFIRSIRNQKQRSFAAIGDGSSLEPLQALLTPEQAQNLSTGTAVQLTGQWKPSFNPKAQSHELSVVELRILGSADSATSPLQKKFHTPEFLRSIPHLRTRTPFNSTLLRFRSQSIAELTKFFAEKDFTQTHPPIITSSDCEGAGEVFSVETEEKGKVTEDSDGSFFRSPKYLTVSSQLHLEALAQSVGRVWTLSPTFRAEKSETARHLSEFYMLEAEVSFTESLDEIMTLVEDMLRSLTTSLYTSRVGQELLHGKRYGDDPYEAAKRGEELERRWQGMMSASWPRITYAEAIHFLKVSGERFEHKPMWESGLQAEHERYIASKIGEGKPVFVTEYPRSIKPFYMLPSHGGSSVECFDLLVPELCEIVGGSMREHRLGPLLENMQRLGMDEGSLKWYIDLRRWGSVPHGGFGLGFDRLLCYLSGVPNIREVVTFPRWVGRCDC